jgi:hypothetical protein
MSISGVYASNYWYKLDQAWGQSRASISQQFLNAGSVMNSALTDAMSNQISGMATLAGQAALKRIQGATATANSASTSTAASTSAAQTAANRKATTSASSGSGSQYARTSAASILSSSNVVSFFA